MNSYPSFFQRCWFGLWMLVISLLFCVGAHAEFSEDIVDHSKQSTVRVFSKSGEKMGSGTGFVVSSKGYVVTNYHVIENSENVAVVYGRGDTLVVKEASIVVSEPGKDLAILKCDALPYTKTFVVVDRETLGGQEVMAIGFPGLLDEMYASHGTSKLRPKGPPDEFVIDSTDESSHVPVSFPGNVGKEMRIKSSFGGDFRAIAHSAKISEGNSGGPLIDVNGRVVGINVQIAANKLGADYAFSIHASELVALARAHSIPIDVTTSKASSAGSLSKTHLILYVVLAAFTVVIFLLVLRKPRMVMVDAMSRVVRPRVGSPGGGQQTLTPIGNSQGTGMHTHSAPSSQMRLRGRDPMGHSYDVTFSEADFRRYGGRLVIGRNRDLSQLVLSHDSVSRQHATLSLINESVLLEDRNSGNGTRLNGRELPVGGSAASLRPGDKVTLGEIDLIFDRSH